MDIDLESSEAGRQTCISRRITGMVKPHWVAGGWPLKAQLTDSSLHDSPYSSAD